MLVHFVETIEQRAEVLRSDGQHRRKADGGIHRIPSTDPIPKAEHVLGVNAEGGDFLGVG